jgi:hypothetical protein
MYQLSNRVDVIAMTRAAKNASEKACWRDVNMLDAKGDRMKAQPISKMK